MRTLLIVISTVITALNFAQAADKSPDTKSRLCDALLRENHIITEKGATLNGKADWTKPNGDPLYASAEAKVDKNKDGKIINVVTGYMIPQLEDASTVWRTYRFEYDKDGTCYPVRISESFDKSPTSVVMDLTTCKKIDNFYKSNKSEIEKCDSAQTKLAEILGSSPMTTPNDYKDLKQTDGTLRAIVGGFRESCQRSYTIQQMMKDQKVGAFIYQKEKSGSKASSEAQKSNATK